MHARPLSKIAVSLTNAINHSSSASESDDAPMDKLIALLKTVSMVLHGIAWHCMVLYQRL